MNELTEKVTATNCPTAADTRERYLHLVRSRVCGWDGGPCLRENCRHCGELVTLIDQRGFECEGRGCTLRKCIFD